MTKQKPKPKPRPNSTTHNRVNTSIKKDYTSYWLIAGLILTLIVYFPSLFNGITNWDDDVYINNPFVKNLSPGGILNLFSVYFEGNYHPLTLLSLAIDRLIGGGTPFIFHFTNLLFHLANTYLVFVLVRKLAKNDLLALVTFILFGVHTLHIESVAWISERKDVLYSFFYLLSLIVYINYASKQKGIHYGLSLLLFLFSLLAKGQAVVLVAVLPLIDFFLGRKWFSIKILSEKIPFFLLFLIFAWVAFRAQQSANALHIAHFPLSERFAFASFGLTQYLIKSIFPVGLSADYPYPLRLLTGNIPTFYWLFIILLPFYIAGSYFLFRRSKIYAFGLGLFILNLLPVLQIIPVGGAIMADRYFYIPSVGLLLCFAMGLLEIRKAAMKNALLFLFICIFSVLSFFRCTIWKDSITLWNDVISKYDYTLIACFNRGVAYRNLGEWDKAIADYTKAIELDPKYAEAYCDRGVSYSNLGQWEKAISDYSSAIRINPQFPDAISNRGIAYCNLLQWDKAITDYSRAIGVNPNNKEAYTNRGIALCNLDEWDKAIADYSKAIEIDPQFANGWFNRGNAYGNLGQWDKAIADYSRAIEIDPGFTEAIANRDVVYKKKQSETKP